MLNPRSNWDEPQPDPGKSERKLSFNGRITIKFYKAIFRYDFGDKWCGCSVESGVVINMLGMYQPVIELATS